MLEIFTSIAAWQEFRSSKIFLAKTLGLVPTMGNLHAGHQALIQRSIAENDFTVMSIYVNPQQFDDNNEFNHYPRTVEQDIELARRSGVNWIIMPKNDEIYPDHFHFRVSESELSQKCCGKFRPGHFTGVLTIVIKLLMLAQATRAYFGEKDWQQLQLVRGLVQAFFIPTTIVGVSVVRDANGLALSSRNGFLTEHDYQLALQFPRILRQQLTPAKISQQLSALGMQVDYIEDLMGRRLGAVRVGAVRLIDNVECNYDDNDRTIEK